MLVIEIAARDLLSDWVSGFLSWFEFTTYNNIAVLFYFNAFELLKDYSNDFLGFISQLKFLERAGERLVQCRLLMCALLENLSGWLFEDVLAAGGLLRILMANFQILENLLVLLVIIVLALAKILY